MTGNPKGESKTVSVCMTADEVDFVTRAADIAQRSKSAWGAGIVMQAVSSKQALADALEDVASIGHLRTDTRDRVKRVSIILRGVDHAALHTMTRRSNTTVHAFVQAVMVREAQRIVNKTPRIFVAMAAEAAQREQRTALLIVPARVAGAEGYDTAEAAHALAKEVLALHGLIIGEKETIQGVTTQAHMRVAVRHAMDKAWDKLNLEPVQRSRLSIAMIEREADEIATVLSLPVVRVYEACFAKASKARPIAEGMAEIKEALEHDIAL